MTAPGAHRKSVTDYCPGLPTLPDDLLERLTYDPSEADQEAGSAAIGELCELIRARARPRQMTMARPGDGVEYEIPVVADFRR